MKRINFLLALLILTGAAVRAQAYTFDSIPGHLKIRANAVIRSEQCLYKILGPGKAIEKVKRVITLINENADVQRYITVRYDGFSKINYLRGVVYDEKGKIIKMLGVSDVYDMSAITGASFYSDNRMKLLYIPKYKYPYTIEYDYEIEYSSIMNYPTWYFRKGNGIAVEKSGIQIVIPQGMKFRYFERNLKNKVDSVLTDGSRVYTWQEEDLRASVPREYSLMSPLDTEPVLFTGPIDFEYGGYKGSMESWKSFGEWNYNLIKDLDKLPAQEIEKVSEIMALTKDERERARLIYEYVQSKTRYVSIDIGIGGYKPADPSSVSVNGFGDCKALAYFTKALLKEAGINSYYALVRSGKNNNINRNFVNQQFDHVILCVPVQSDTVWLECTSPTYPFNYLGSATDDRYALLITPEGGKLARTQVYGKNENLIKRTGSVTIYDKIPSLFKISHIFSGYFYGDHRVDFFMKTDEELKSNLYESLRFYDFTVNSVSYSENKSEKPSAGFNYGISVNDFTVRMDNRIGFNPALEEPFYLQDSPGPMLISASGISTDSITYYLPYGYEIEYTPENMTLNNEFGRFKYYIQIESDRIIYKRYLELNKQIVSAEKFGELRKFINSVAKADGEMIILRKKGRPDPL